MAKVKDAPEVMEEDMHACSFCGNTPDAFWVGCGAPVTCCRNCAEHILPKLAADAVMPIAVRDETFSLLKNSLTRISASFWEAAFVGILRTIDDMKKLPF